MKFSTCKEAANAVVKLAGNLNQQTTWVDLYKSKLYNNIRKETEKRKSKIKERIIKSECNYFFCCFSHKMMDNCQLLSQTNFF